MSLRLLAAALAFAALVGLSSKPVLADLSGCSDAIDTYNSLIEEVSSALRSYASCVSSSEGKDDCSLEFGRLRRVQDEFESAVSEIGSYCD